MSLAWCISGIEDTQTRCIALREIIQTLHPIHVRVMKFLFEFLYK